MSYTSHFSPYFVQSCFPFKYGTSGPTSNKDSLVYFPYPTSRQLSSILDQLAQNSVFCFPLLSSFSHRHYQGYPYSTHHYPDSHNSHRLSGFLWSLVTPLHQQLGVNPHILSFLSSNLARVSSADIASHSIFTLPNIGSRISDAISEICKLHVLLGALPHCPFSYLCGFVQLVYTKVGQENDRCFRQCEMIIEDFDSCLR